MSKRIGRWRGEVDEPSGLKALGTIGSAPATFMMCQGSPFSGFAPTNRPNTRLQPISAYLLHPDRPAAYTREKTGPPPRLLQEESIHGFTAALGKPFCDRGPGT